MSNSSDRELEMGRAIARRDFLNGVGLTVGAALVPGTVLEALSAEPAPGLYPPARTGMRGSHDGSWEVAHELRDGKSWSVPGDTDEAYDLVVVGGGISGLSAAFFYRETAGVAARILILDNHDDFGGHAKRNEFIHDGRVLALNGGTLEIESPSRYPAVAKRLLAAIGVDIERFRQATASGERLYSSLGLGAGVFFDKETFGVDRLVAGRGQLPWPEFLARTPLSESARRDIARLYDAAANDDYMPGLTSLQKKERLGRMSYRDFLLDAAHVHPDVIPFFQAHTHGIFALGIDAVPALYLWEMGYPGFRGMNLEPTPEGLLADLPGGQHGRQRESEETPVHFPDGNATLARLLVRALLPQAVPGGSMEDVVTARVDYGRLDSAGASVRIRLSSTVVRVQPEGKSVAVTFVHDGRSWRVHGRHCVLACWNMLIPRLCPELPESQKRALAYGVKAPIVYTNVLLRDWKAFAKLGVSSIAAPGSFHTRVSLAEAVSLGAYEAPRSPDEPMVIQLVRTPCRPGLSKKEQHEAGRAELVTMTFADFERKIRDQLGRTLTAGGFDPARDIEAITVNRWPHGYAYTYNTLFDPVPWAMTASEERPCVAARRAFGRIAIANADAAASPHTDAAILEAHRAVRELLG